MSSSVAVLIVAYNAEKYIAKTLDSCLQQSYTDFHIYILDNNSSDTTRDIIQSYISTHPQITLHTTHENIGPYRGLNFLIDRLPPVEYIAIQDHDDIWHPKKLEHQMTYMIAHPDAPACGSMSVIYFEDSGKHRLRYKGSRSRYVPHTSLLFRYYPGFRYDEKMLFLGDGYTMTRYIAMWKKSLYNIAQPLVLHRMRSDNNNLSSKWFEISWPYIHRLLYVVGYTPNGFAILLFEICKRWIYLLHKRFHRSTSLISRIVSSPLKVRSIMSTPQDKVYIQKMISML